MKNLFFTALAAFTFMSFNPAEQKDKQATEKTAIEWVTLCFGKDSRTGNTIRLLSNSRTGLRMVGTYNSTGNLVGDLATTTSTTAQFAQWCDERGYNCH